MGYLLKLPWKAHLTPKTRKNPKYLVCFGAPRGPKPFVTAIGSIVFFVVSNSSWSITGVVMVLEPTTIVIFGVAPILHVIYETGKLN